MNCPACERVIYSRQQKRCGYCGAILPEELRLADHEIDEMKAEMREIETRRQAAKAEEEKEREERRKREQNWQTGGGFTGM